MPKYCQHHISRFQLRKHIDTLANKYQSETAAPFPSPPLAGIPSHWPTETLPPSPFQIWQNHTGKQIIHFLNPGYAPRQPATRQQASHQPCFVHRKPQHVGLTHGTPQNAMSQIESVYLKFWIRKQTLYVLPTGAAPGR